MNKSLYIWLYRNDRDWLNENSPNKKRTINKNTRVDWDNRDRELLSKVKEVVDEILDSKEKPIRITISLVGSKLGIKSMIEKHLDKMPLTKEYLDEKKESIRDFQIRRIDWAVRELENKGEDLKSWKIFRKAGIRKEYQEELIDEVEKFIYNLREE